MKIKLIGFLIAVVVIVLLMAGQHKKKGNQYENEMFFGNLHSTSETSTRTQMMG